jgi:hypothetical protein
MAMALTFEDSTGTRDAAKGGRELVMEIGSKRKERSPKGALFSN